jgi:UDP-N-acetylmuramyl tripeptide synthase
VCHDREKAIQEALSLAGPGDCVLIAGKGNEKFQWVGETRRKHDDREIARKWLYANSERVR